MASSTRDPFEALGITPDFSSREVNRRCEQLRVQLRLTQRTEELEQVDDACRTLRDPVQRTTALFWSYLLAESRDVDLASAPSVENHLAWLVAPETQASQPAGFAIHDTAVLTTQAFVADGTSSANLERALLGWKAVSKNGAFWQAFGERAGAGDPLIAAEVTRLRETVFTDAARRLEAGFDASNTTADLNRIRGQIRVVRGCGLPREAQDSLVDRATRSIRQRSQDALEEFSREVREILDSDSSAKSDNWLAVRQAVCRYVSGPCRDILAFRAVDPANPDTSVEDALARVFMALAGAALILGGDIADAIRIGDEGLRVARSESVKIELRASAAQLLIRHHDDSAESAWNIGDPASAVAHLELAAESVTEDQPAAVLRETARKIRARLGRGVAAQVEARKAEIRRQIASFHGPLSELCASDTRLPQPLPPPPKQQSPPTRGAGRWLVPVCIASAVFLWLVGPWRGQHSAPSLAPSLTATMPAPPSTRGSKEEPVVIEPTVHRLIPSATTAGNPMIPSDGLFDPSPGSLQTENGYSHRRIYNFETEGRSFIFEVKVRHTLNQGGIVLSLNDVDRPEVTWLFTVTNDTWKLDEIVDDTVNPWVHERRFLSPVDAPIKTVQLAVRGHDGTLYVNGTQVSSLGNILFSEDLGTNWRVGIGVAPNGDAQSAAAFYDVDFESVRVTFNPE